ncbi:MAG: MBL fold metallo-hydrolase [Deltaproteobacteria bacterium]|nr:MBL fold metallo-hydrolase [Deltaproteobacteria bacterium]
MKTTERTLPRLGLLLLSSTLACQTTSHDTQPAGLGTSSRTSAMEQNLEAPGPIHFERVLAADWVVTRAGLINLEHPEAQKAGLEDGDEPIQIYFYALRHPTRGLFLVDTGVEAALRDDPDRAAVRGLVRAGMNAEALKIHQDTKSWLAAQPTKVAGVLMTHLHLDHVMGLPDVPAGTPVYTGPGEGGARSFLNAFVQGSTDRTLAHLPPLSELEFQPDPDGRSAGVLDLFGDGSVYAISAPGHTPGSVAYLIRSTEGPVLLTGDTCHTKFGWEHEVEPGDFTADQAQNRAALLNLTALQKTHPTLRVYLGHQSL